MIKENGISHDEAMMVIESIKREILRRGKSGVIAVADNHGELIALLRMDGAPYSSVTIASNKAFTAARERKPTYLIGQAVRDADKNFEIGYFGDSRFTGWGGGMPVIVAGQVIGAVAVSGLPEVEDVELAGYATDLLIRQITSG